MRKLSFKIIISSGLMLLVIVALGLFSASSVFAEDVNQTADEVARGKTIYSTNCASCHGAEAQGVRAPALAATSRTLDFVTNKVRGNPRGNMPVFPETRVSNDDIRLIYAYVRSLPAVQGGTSPATGQGGAAPATSPTAAPAPAAPATGSGGTTTQEGFNASLLMLPLAFLLGLSSTALVLHRRARR